MKNWLLLLVIPILSKCTTTPTDADAFGNFEAREVLVSSEVAGKILFLQVEEGQTLPAGQLVGLVDTSTLHLRKRQLEASIHALRRKTQDIKPQIEVLQTQRNNLLRERNRLKALVESNLAPSQKLDELEGQLAVTDQQILAAQSQNQNLNDGILAEISPLSAQIDQVNDQIAKCHLFNPIDGTVLLKITEDQEIAVPGKALYSIADLNEMYLRVYLSGEQLGSINLGQEVRIRLDDGAEGNKEMPGLVSWISSKAEFTPKIVQTKDQRVNLVYAVKITVKNDGTIKIGMPGELIIPR